MWHFSMSQLLSNRIFTTQCSLPYSRKTAETGFWQKRMQNAFTMLWGINKNKDKHKTACSRRELVKPSWSAASWGSAQIHWYPTHAHTAGASLQCSGSSAAWGHVVAVKQKHAEKLPALAPGAVALAPEQSHAWRFPHSQAEPCRAGSVDSLWWAHVGCGDTHRALGHCPAAAQTEVRTCAASLHTLYNSSELISPKQSLTPVELVESSSSFITISWSTCSPMQVSRAPRLA